MDQPVLPQQELKKKCHGNRRDQRFRRKCRALNMKPKKIEKILKKRNNRQNKQNQKRNNANSTMKNNQQATILNPVLTHSNRPILLPPTTMTTATSTNRTTTIVTKLNKRKRDISIQDIQRHSKTMIPKSTSTISVGVQHLKKKPKIAMLTNHIQHMTYRFVFLYRTMI